MANDTGLSPAFMELVRVMFGNAYMLATCLANADQN